MRLLWPCLFDLREAPLASPVLVTVSWVCAMFVTFIALVSLGRGVAHLVRQFSAGAPDGTRVDRPLLRAWGVVSAALTHREFKGRLAVRVAHWLVMMSFPLLFLTLVSGYFHLRDQHWALPVLGGNPLWHWLVDVFAWAGLLGIIALMCVRGREGRGSLAEAALSGSDGGGDADQDASADGERGRGGRGSLGHPRRDGSWQGRASRFLGSTRWQALFVEWVVLLVCACVLVLQGLDYALQALGGAQPQWWMFPLTWFIGQGFVWLFGSGSDAVVWVSNAIVLVSLLKIVVSMTWMAVVGVQTSMGVAWHRFLAVFNLYFRRYADGRKSLGAAAPMLVAGKPVSSADELDALMEQAEQDQADADGESVDLVLGVGETQHLTWKARMDLASCTECGRCQELCPAWNTQKPLSPKLLVMSLRDHVESASNYQVVSRQVSDAEIPGGSVEALADRELIDKGVEPSPHSVDLLQVLSSAGTTGVTGVSTVEGALVPDVVDDGVLWDCTMCGACVDQCPVDIEHVDHILDLRRYQVLMESAFPRELGRAFRGMELKQNPYNQPARKRVDWAKKLPFDVPVIGQDIEDATEVDYLLWVGCAGAYDDKAKETSAAIAQLLHTAGVSFAVLGAGESCTGDPARRAGNEVLFQMLAGAAIEALQEAKAQRIIVSCAHCFNTIAGEFPDLGGHFEVIHHTQVLARLVREGKLTPVAPHSSQGHRITYHDPCFLGRHNQIFDAPREVLASLGADLVEMPRHGALAMCCGAGGARAWMEESRGIRIADARMVEAASTGAETLATACPFCSQMLGAATGASAGFVAGEDAQMPAVRDVAVLMLQAVQRSTEQE